MRSNQVESTPADPNPHNSHQLSSNCPPQQSVVLSTVVAAHARPTNCQLNSTLHHQNNVDERVRPTFLHETSTQAARQYNHYTPIPNPTSVYTYHPPRITHHPIRQFGAPIWMVLVGGTIRSSFTADPRYVRSISLSLVFSLCVRTYMNVVRLLIHGTRKKFGGC